MKNVMKKVMTKMIVALSVLMALTTLSWAAESVNVEDGVGLKGFDPVSYYISTPTLGTESFSASYAGVSYYFADEENLALFNQGPQQYLPAYGGWCAFAMLEGDAVDVDPESFKIIEGKLYVFYDGFWGDTRKKWNKLALDTAETELVSTADGQWQMLLSDSEP